MVGVFGGRGRGVGSDCIKRVVIELKSYRIFIETQLDELRDGLVGRLSREELLIEKDNEIFERTDGFAADTLGSIVYREVDELCENVVFEQVLHARPCVTIIAAITFKDECIDDALQATWKVGSRYAKEECSFVRVFEFGLDGKPVGVKDIDATNGMKRGLLPQARRAGDPSSCFGRSGYQARKTAQVFHFVATVGATGR